MAGKVYRRKRVVSADLSQVENCKTRAPPSWGEERRGYLSHRILLLLFEGKRKLERQILNGDAQHQLLRVLAAFEPHGPGNLIVRIDGSGLERQSANLQRGVDQHLLALLADGVVLGVLMLEQIIGRGSRWDERVFVARVGGAQCCRRLQRGQLRGSRRRLRPERPM